MTYPAITDPAVIPLPDEGAGEVPNAFVVTNGSITPEVPRFVADYVAPYKRVRAVEIIDEVPTAPSGKILRRVLIARARGLAHLAETTRASGTDWAVGVEACSRALVSDGEIAERLYSEAIERLRRTRVRAELARAHLLYGEWLRRKNRRLDARRQLRTAHNLFTEFGMEAFAERARVELEATGEHARKRTVETRDDLTQQ
ncbi:MAG: AMP-binding enzyme, partial [Solirubrobacteraceae bacterium]